MTGFGRKGLDQQVDLAPSAPRAAEGLRNGNRPPFRPQPSGAMTSSRVDAFIAAERARGVREPEQAGVSDVAASYRGTAAPPQRQLWMAYLLWFFFGQLSAHRFYLGAYQSAMVQVGLFVTVVVLALSAPGGSISTMGPVMGLLIIAWALWVLGDVFVIHRIHRKLCRRPGELASAFA
jgi:hypothetical protein